MAPQDYSPRPGPPGGRGPGQQLVDDDEAVRGERAPQRADVVPGRIL